MVESTSLVEAESAECGMPDEFKQQPHGTTAHMHGGSAPKVQHNPAKQTVEVAALLFQMI